MKLAGLHPDEQRRLQSLRSSGLLNSGKEERFDRLTRLARSLYNLPVASISLVGEDLLHIKSCAGLDVDTVPRDISFCAHTILQTDPLIVNDMQQDERFHDNPLVIEAPFIRFYAGYPVQLPDGATVGSFCLMDHQPRSFSAHEMQILSDLAAIVEDEFKVLDAATSDELTGLFNRRGFLTLAEYALLTAQRRHEPVSLAFVDLDRFKHINDTWGHEEGDRALIAIADLMKAAFRESDILARQGGGRIYHSVRQYQPPRCRDGDGDAQPQRGAFQPAGGQSLAAGVLLGLRRIRSRQPSQSQRAGGHRRPPDVSGEAETGARTPLILCRGGIEQVLLRLLPLLRIVTEQRLLRFPSVVVKQAAFVGDKAIMLFQLVYHPVNALQGE